MAAYNADATPGACFRTPPVAIMGIIARSDKDSGMWRVYTQCKRGYVLVSANDVDGACRASDRLASL